jgi:hypothetical protein
MIADEEQSNVVTIRNWTVVLAFVSWLVGGIWMFSSLRATADESVRRIEVLEHNQPVTIDQYREGQRAIEQRLDRIERKLDAK